jgi:hypothetical protein
MEKEIKVIDTEGLTGAESIYEAFIKNDWKPLSSSQLAHSTKKNIGSIGALVSTFCKNNMLIRKSFIIRFQRIVRASGG